MRPVAREIHLVAERLRSQAANPAESDTDPRSEIEDDIGCKEEYDLFPMVCISYGHRATVSEKTCTAETSVRMAFHQPRAAPLCCLPDRQGPMIGQTVSFATIIHWVAVRFFEAIGRTHLEPHSIGPSSKSWGLQDSTPARRCFSCPWGPWGFQRGVSDGGSGHAGRGRRQTI